MLDEYMIFALDNTGIKVTNRGRQMNKKWYIQKQNRKGCLEIHIAVDIKNEEILSYKVTADEHVHDGKMLSKLVDEIVKSTIGL